MKKHNFNINKWLFVFYFLLLNFYLSSCKKTETYSSASIADYNPSQTGKYITYKLDSLIYLSFGTRDTTVSYQVKYLTDSLITDNLGRPAYRIFRFIRKDENYSWAPDATFMSVNTGNNLEFIDNWNYVYSNVGGADVVGSFNLDNTLTVNQRDEIIGIPDDPGSYSEVNFSQEKYSKGIGMVYRKFFHSEYQPNNGGYFADGSYGVTYTMIDHN